MVNTLIMLKYTLHTLLLILVMLPLGAQDISFVAKAPDQVKVGDQFSVIYEINEKVKDFKPPQFNDFVFLGSQKGFSSVNWKTSYKFTFFFKATQTGKFTIGSAEAKHDGDKIFSNELTIEVVSAANQQQATTTQKANEPTPNVSENSVDGEDMFVRLLIDNKSPYVGEQVVAYVKVYTKVPLADIPNTFQGPEFTGFYVQNTKTPPLRSLEPEKIGNKTYYSGVVRKLTLIPQRSGKITIQAFEVPVLREEKVQVGFFTTYQHVSIPLTTKQVTLDVKALPPGKPAGFGGAIGNFNITAALNSDEVQTNDAIVFNVKVSGQGNIKLIDDIKYSLPPTFDAFDPVVKTNIADDGQSGSKIFEITAIPRHAGEFMIKPFELVYFNSKTGSYVTKKTESFIINVAKGEGDTSAVVISGLSKEDVELLESDIRYINTDTKLINKANYFIDSVFYYLIIVLQVAFFVLILVLRREQIKRSADLAKSKHRRASRLAGKRFKLASKMQAQGNREGFYEELSKAVWGYISDKLNIPTSELSTLQAREKLVQKNVKTEYVDELLEILDTCEFARYAPGTDYKQPSELLKKANKVVTKIDQNI
jgi:hypothetical protein